MRKKLKKLFSGAGMLAICSVTAKLLGALFRIPLTNIAGAEGIGLYQMVFPLYTVLLTVSSGGINTAIAKVVSRACANSNHKEAIKILKISLISLSVFGAAAGIVLVLFRKNIAAAQGNPLAALAYLGIAPSVLFVAVISVLRGFFQGYGNMLPGGLSQIAEQVIKLIFGLMFAALLLPRGVEYAVLGATIGVTLSEVAAMLILGLQFWVFYARRRRAEVIPLKRLNAESASFSAPPAAQVSKSSAIFKSVYAIAIPVTLGSLIMPLTQLIDSVMVINVLALRGMERAAATSLFGLVGGPIGSLVNMPVAVTLAISVALLPKIAYFKEKEKQSKSLVQAAVDLKTIRYLENNIEVSEEFLPLESSEPQSPIPDSQPPAATKTVGKSIAVVLLLSLPSAAMFMFFPRQIVSVLYSRGLSASQLDIAAQLLRIESLSVIYIGLIQISTAVLQGADKPHRPAINLLYGAIIKVLLTLILLPKLGIKGAAIATVLCYGTVAAIDIFYMKKIIRPQLKFFKSVLMPIFSCAALVLTTYFLFKAFTAFLPQFYAFIAAAGAGAVVYGLCLVLSKSISIKDFFK